MSDKNHECSACGGTGRIHRDHRMADCWHKSHFCPACHGSGRISDVMPVSDAVADAETLRLSLPHYGEHAEAKAWGEATIDASRNGWTFVDHAEASRRCAINAARAAFRAVPGLRG